MKGLRLILLIVFVLVLIAGAGVIGFMKGVNLIRNGLVENYPTIKNLVQNTTVDFDSIITIDVNSLDNRELYLLVATNKTSKVEEDAHISVPYHATYGLAPRACRAVRTDEGVEVMLPAIEVRYTEFNFENALINDLSAKEVFYGTDGLKIRGQLKELAIKQLNKVRPHKEAAKKKIATALVYYFVPYEFKLKIFFDNQPYELPKVPGVNQKVDDALKEIIEVKEPANQ